MIPVRAPPREEDEPGAPDEGAGEATGALGADITGAGAEYDGRGADIAGAGAENEGRGADIAGAGAEKDCRGALGAVGMLLAGADGREAGEYPGAADGRDRLGAGAVIVGAADRAGTPKLRPGTEGAAYPA